MRSTYLHRGLLALLAAVASLLLGVSPAAAATTRYAKPSGSGSACTEATPCSLQTAIAMTAPGAGDRVIAFGNSGTYGTPGSPIGSQVILPFDATLEGFPGQPRPQIYSSAPTFAVRVENGAHLADFEIRRTDEASAWALFLVGSADRVIAIAAHSTACGTTGEAVLTNSVCAGAWGIYDSSGGGVKTTLQVRNSTVVGYEHEGASFYSSGGLEQDLSFVNSIVSGVAHDIKSGQFTGGKVVVTLSHSNYDVVEAETGTTITPPGTGGNQTAPPQFVDLAGVDLHEASGSPTIDAGVDDPANGTLDLDGNARSLPRQYSCDSPTAPIPDIGAYEFNPPGGPPTCPPPRASTAAPHTRLGKATIRKRKRKATFRFDASGKGGPFHFECALDKKPFRACASPKKYRNLKAGKHVFRVRAVNAAGTPDPTPATRKFHAGKRRRH